MIKVKKKNIIGLDIGSSSIKLVELGDGKNGYKLQNMGMSSLPPEAIVDGALMDSGIIIDTIRNLVSTAKSKTKDVVTSISGPSVMVKKITLPPMTEAELEESIQWEAERYIPFDVHDVNIDFKILGGGEAKSDVMEVVLVSAKKDIINDYVSVIIESGLNPIIIDIDAFALENMIAVNYEIGKEEVVAIANVGGSITNINIIQNNITAGFTRDIFQGGSKITEEIQRQLNIEYEEAEKIKLGDKVREDSKVILENIMKTAYETLSVEIGNTLDFFQNTMTDKKISKLFLSGGGSKLKDFETYLSQHIGMPVVIVNPFNKIEYSDNKFSYEYLNEMGPFMAVGVGLASRRVGDK